LLTERQKTWLFLAIMFAFLLLMAAFRPLSVPDEGRYGEVGRWMWESGDWVTPRLNGLPFFHKPPFVYWLEGMSIGLLGNHEFALRLIPAFHVLLMTLVMHAGMTRVFDEKIARRAVMMLATSLTFLVGGQYVNHDMVVATWITIAVVCFAFSFMAGDCPDPVWARWGFVACAVGFLSKGLIGFVLPGMVIFFWLVWTRQLKKLVRIPWLSGLGLFLLLSAPWIILTEQKFPGFFDYMFVNQHFKRFTTSNYNNQQPFWFYILALIVLFFPWIFFAVGRLKSQVTKERDKFQGKKCAWFILCWTWLVAITIFFSIPTSKLVGYILPTIPPLACLAALGWDAMMSKVKLEKLIFTGICVINLIIGLAITYWASDFTKQKRSKDVAEVLACAASPNDYVYVLGGYPYDLPFYAQTTRPLIVIENWINLRKNARDGWHRELFEGADFDLQAAKNLQSPVSLAVAAGVPGNWLVTNVIATDESLKHWQLDFSGVGWRMYRSSGTLASKSPKPTEHKSLPGCRY